MWGWMSSSSINKSLLYLILIKMSHFFNHIMVREEHDILNWILDESDRFTLKSARTSFLEPGVPCGWGKFIWSSSILPSKTLVLWKVFMCGFLPINIFRIKVCIYILCVHFVKSMKNLFNIYFLNVLILCIFEVRFDKFFLLLISLINMIFFLLLRVTVVVWLNWLSLLW